MRTDTLLAFYSPPFPSQIQFCPTREIMGFWTQVAIFAGPGALYTVMAVQVPPSPKLPTVFFAQELPFHLLCLRPRFQVDSKKGDRSSEWDWTLAASSQISCTTIYLKRHFKQFWRMSFKNGIKFLVHEIMSYLTSIQDSQPNIQFALISRSF